MANDLLFILLSMVSSVDLIRCRCFRWTFLDHHKDVLQLRLLCGLQMCNRLVILLTVPEPVIFIFLEAFFKHLGS